MNKKIAAITIMLCVMSTLSIGLLNGAENSKGASITNSDHKLSSSVIPNRSRFRLSTSCGKFSESKRVAGVMWYDKNSASSLCNLKGEHFRVERGTVVSKDVAFEIHTTHWLVGVYAGKCEKKDEASKDSGIGSTLATERK